MNIQGWFPLGLTGLISLLSRDSQESSLAPQFESINSDWKCILDLKWHVTFIHQFLFQDYIQTNACICTPRINKNILGIIFHNEKKKDASHISKERKLLIMQHFVTIEYHTTTNMNSLHKHRWITIVMVSQKC